MSMRAYLLLYGVLCLTTGCTSIESTMVTRDESNHDWEQHRCLNGIPITLKVPTHLKLYVFHKHYLELVGGQQVVPVDVDVVVRDFAHDFMYTDKMFVVDFKRPLAGSSNLRVDMTPEQYIDQIQHDVTDETIQKIGGLLGALAPRGIGGGAAPAGTRAEQLKELKSLVATGIFEIAAPDFEQQVMQFINCHVNKSHDAWVVPPGIEDVNRVGIPGSENIQVPYPTDPLCPAQDGSYEIILPSPHSRGSVTTIPVEKIPPGPAIGAPNHSFESLPGLAPSATHVNEGSLP